MSEIDNILIINRIRRIGSHMPNILDCLGFQMFDDPSLCQHANHSFSDIFDNNIGDRFMQKRKLRQQKFLEEWCRSSIRITVADAKGFERRAYH